MANAAEVRTGGQVSPRHPGLQRVPGVPVAPTVLSMLQTARRVSWRTQMALFLGSRQSSLTVTVTLCDGRRRTRQGQAEWQKPA